MSVHPTAVVDSEARLGAEVEIGPYAVIGAGVVVGDRCRIGPHAVLQGPLVLGEECVLGPSATLGQDPQVQNNPGPFGGTRIGARCVFREFSQVHRSMFPDKETVIGDDCYFMATAHAAHDCRLGNGVTLCNGVLLAGHVEVGDRVFMGGLVGIHQFARVGAFAMVAGGAHLNRDTPPYCTVAGDRPKDLAGLNSVGLRRAGFEAETRRALKEAFRVLFRGDAPLAERLAAVDRSVAEVARLAEFVESTKRGVVGIAGR